MMKRFATMMGALLLMPTLVLASGDMVSISELRQQAEAMGRWTKTYEAYGRTIEVDVPIRVPSAEKVPILECVPWKISEKMTDEIKKETKAEEYDGIINFESLNNKDTDAHYFGILSKERFEVYHNSPSMLLSRKSQDFLKTEKAEIPIDEINENEAYAEDNALTVLEARQEVDIPILMPDVEECPVITVENDKPFNREMVNEMQNRATRDDVFTVFPYEMNERNFEIVWGTNGWNGSTADYDEVTDFSIGTGIWRQTAHVKKSRFFSTPIVARYPWEMDLSESVIRNGNQTVEQVMNNWQGLIDAMYPGRDYTIAPKWIRIYGYTQMDSDEADEGNGHYLITAEQVIGGLPVFGAIYSYGDFQIPYASTPETNKKQEKLRAYATGAFWKTRSILQIRSSSNDDYAANIGMNKVRSVELEDIPLASMEKVMQEIEKEISKGNIRNVYALRLGYMRYSNPDMKDYAWAIPMWVLDCKYITEENRETADSVEENTQDEVALIWDAYGFSQIPIDAQTGKMKIITTGDEETFSVPKVITWEDVQ